MFNEEIYSSCLHQHRLLLVNNTQENRQTVMTYLEPVLKLAPSIAPTALGLFAGSLNPIVKSIVPGKGPYCDFREWDKIRAWARKIRPVLHEKESGWLAFRLRRKVVCMLQANTKQARS